MKGNGNAPLLEVRNISKYFGNVIALKDVSAAVGDVTDAASVEAARSVLRACRPSPSFFAWVRKRLALTA